ncbi:hypothetical protein D7316_02250 [Gordonia insulae]|uniref:Uncharacterized protein n=1 Tax=Gordonia insulae TaxID=2420509 RepID=A0A3G8JNA0_9ACTN|nr:hypothetical protein D7316_02250 [Gordonia insulae]
MRYLEQRDGRLILCGLVMLTPANALQLRDELDQFLTEHGPRAVTPAQWMKGGDCQ